MKKVSAAAAKNSFGQVMDDARLAPLVIQKHGRSVIVMCAVEEFERLQKLAGETVSSAPPESS